MSVAATKFQKGEERYILRSQIKEDPTIPASLGRGRKSVSAPLSKSTACSEPSSGTSVLETSFLDTSGSRHSTTTRSSGGRELSAPRNRGGSDGPGRKTGQRIPEQS